MNRKEADAVIEAKRIIMSVRKNIGIILTESTIDDYSWLGVYALSLDKAVAMIDEAVKEEDDS